MGIDLLSGKELKEILLLGVRDLLQFVEEVWRQAKGERTMPLSGFQLVSNPRLTFLLEGDGVALFEVGLVDRAHLRRMARHGGDANVVARLLDQRHVLVQAHVVEREQAIIPQAVSPEHALAPIRFDGAERAMSRLFLLKPELLHLRDEERLHLLGNVCNHEASFPGRCMRKVRRPRSRRGLRPRCFPCNLPCCAQVPA